MFQLFRVPAAQRCHPLRLHHFYFIVFDIVLPARFATNGARLKVLWHTLVSGVWFCMKIHGLVYYCYRNSSWLKFTTIKWGFVLPFSVPDLMAAACGVSRSILRLKSWISIVFLDNMPWPHYLKLISFFQSARDSITYNSQRQYIGAWSKWPC